MDKLETDGEEIHERKIKKFIRNKAKKT